MADSQSIKVRHPMNDPAHADYYRPHEDNRHDWAVRVIRNHARDSQALATAATILLWDYDALKQTQFTVTSRATLPEDDR